jgi:hypothetical protein
MIRAPRLTGALARTLALGGLSLSTLAGCEDDTKYGYFAVDVTLNEQADADFLARIASCGANVEGADIDFAPINTCIAGQVRSRMLGTFEFSTAETSGNVHFRVTVKDIAGMTLAEGVSPDVPINVGQVTRTSVTVVPLPSALMPRM